MRKLSMTKHQEVRKTKQKSCHTLRHSFATNLEEGVKFNPEKDDIGISATKDKKWQKEIEIVI